MAPPATTRVTRMMLGVGTAGLLAIAGMAAYATGERARAAQAAAKAENPHWKVDGCTACHQAKDGGVVPIDQAGVDRLCLGCHDGTRASAEPHPIGRAFDGEQVRQPEGWPTPSDKLSCLTCHDVIRHCRADAVRASGGGSLLRGSIRGDDPAFCGQCHVEALHTRRNPHRMMGDDGDLDAAACGFCHSDDMAGRVGGQRTGDRKLRTDEMTLCAGCHTSHPDFFSPGHLGAEFNNSMCSPALVRNAEAQRPLPVPEGRRIVCSTCHNPHQRGLFPSDSDLAMGAWDPAATGGPVPLRIPGGGLCYNCHGK